MDDLQIIELYFARDEHAIKETDRKYGNADVQFAEDSFITNTEQICVSADNIATEIEIKIYLYNADDIETPIRTEKLSADEKTVTFTGLSSRFAYRVGATTAGASEPITLKITD